MNPSGDPVSGTSRGRNAFIGAAALVLGALALWLGSDVERKPARESLRSAPPAHTDLDRDSSASTSPAGHERRAVETHVLAEALATHGDALRVDVLDASGRPAAGIPIACGSVSPSAPGVFAAFVRTSTDAGGSAWIELSELAQMETRPSDRSRDSLLLRAEILAEPRPEIVVDRGVDHAVLRLPPLGSVRLEVAGMPGRALPSAVRFGVWARAAGATRDVEPLPRWVPAPTGVAFLEHVGIGLELRVAAALEGDEARPERVVARGPQFAGEERTISVPLGADWPTVVLRALDEHGDVLRNVLLCAETKWTRPGADPTWSSSKSQPRRVRTDADGRVTIPLRGSVEGGFTRRLVLTQGDAGADELAGHVLRSAERDLSRVAATSGEIDLGDIVLRPPERGSDAVVWAAGIVTDDAGSPVQSATVLVSAIDAEGRPVPGPAAQATVEVDGRFRVTGPPVEHRLSVRAVAPGFLRSAEDVVVAGERDLRIRMQAATRWAGRLLLDEDIPPDSLVVEVIQSDRRLRTIPASERISFEGLEQGRIDVEVRTRTGDWLVERWELLPTIPAATPPEERADDLDLRGRLTRLRLRLVDSDGAALDRVFALVHPEPWPEGGGWIHAGCLDLVVPSAARTITVRPRGYPPVAAGLLDGIQELTCGPRIATGA